MKSIVIISMVIVIIVLLVKLEAFIWCCALSFGVLLDRGVGDNDESPFTLDALQRVRRGQDVSSRAKSPINTRSRAIYEVSWCSVFCCFCLI